MDYPWFAEVDEGDGSIEQGDIFRRFPVLAPEYLTSDSGDLTSKLRAKIQFYDVIVLSQSCDLEFDKIDTVICSPVFPIDVFRENNRGFEGKGGDNRLEKIRRGEEPRLHLMNECQVSGLEFPVSIVPFRQIFTLPLGYAKAVANEAGPRVRLRHPYRENLAQAFATFIMRVGLPSGREIPRFN